MSTSIANELKYLGLALLATSYIACVATGSIMLHFSADKNFHPIFTFPLWTTLFFVPVALHAQNQYLHLHKMRLHRCQPMVPFPHKDPILGSDWIRLMARAMKTNTVLETWHKFFNTIGSTYLVNNIGAPIIMTNEPENVKALLQSQFESWPIGGTRRQVTASAVGPKGIFSVNGKEWQTARGMIRPSFVRNQIADLECTDRHVEDFLKKIPRDGKKVDLQDLLYMFTMDVSTDFMFGHSTHTLTKPAQEALDFTESFDYALLSSANRARLGWVAFLVPDKKLNRATETCRKFIDRFVQEALAQEKTKERPYVFMNEMLDTGVSQEYIRDQLLSMILGGRDTGASTMSSMFWLLARRRDVYQKLREEISRLGGRRPTWDEMKELKYMNMVLKETLRLWAPVSTNTRISATDTVLPKGGGADFQSPIFVPKGTNCRWSLYSLHRRQDIFGEDADEFRPERWEKLRTTWEYLPFSGGPRICIGQQFALTQMSYLLTRVVQIFESIEAADDEPMVQQVSTTIKMPGGCWVTLKEA